MSEDCPFCLYEKTEENCPGCFEGSNYRPKPITNADRIRAMTDEELAEFLCYWDNCSSTEGLGYNTERVGDCWLCTAPGGGDIVGECQVCAMAWLKSPVEA